MKLLYITNAINGSGGLERVLATKASYFADVSNYDVHVLVLNNGAEYPFFEFSAKINFHNVSVLGNPISYIQQYVRGIKDVVSKVNPDIVLVCDDGLKAFFLPKILKQFGKPIIYERHVSKLIELPHNASPVQQLIAKVKWRIMERNAKKFAAFVVLTEGNKQEWKSLTNLVVIPNPLPELPIEKSSLSAKRIISVGKVSYQKGQDIMVAIWDRIAEKFPEWEWHNYGKLDDDFVDSNALPKRMYFHPPVKDINSEYLNSSIFALTSRYEGFGMVLIEAMACGVPCVSFDCNYGPGDIIRNGEDGFLIENGNMGEFSAKQFALIKSEELRRTMGEKAQINVQRFAEHSVLEQWHQLFLKLINNES